MPKVWTTYLWCRRFCDLLEITLLQTAPLRMLVTSNFHIFIRLNSRSTWKDDRYWGRGGVWGRRDGAWWWDTQHTDVNSSSTAQKQALWHCSIRSTPQTGRSDRTTLAPAHITNGKATPNLTHMQVWSTGHMTIVFIQLASEPEPHPAPVSTTFLSALPSAFSLSAHSHSYRWTRERGERARTRTANLRPVDIGLAVGGYRTQT